MKLAQIFSNHMVLQQNKPMRVFGEGEGEIRVTFLGQTKIASADGRWLVEFDARPCGGPYEMTVESNGESVTFTDIMIGEVLLCSGQSNMQFHLSEEITSPEEYRSDPMMRTFVSRRPECSEPFQPEDGWQPCQKETAGNWTAIGYHTARELRRTRNCAVGVIACSQGASIIQSWIDEKVYETSFLYDPEVVPFHKKRCPAYTWNEDGMLYHFMLEPLIPYSVGSVIWYQGESNAFLSDPDHYVELLAMMIGSWRLVFGDPSLPFYVVQIADFVHAGDQARWKKIQEEQLRAERVIPCVKTVVCADICESDDIHPKTKYRLAARIAAAMEE
ncbi:MAG: hypothetical protein IJ493_07705 [Clostridia bacterium]|nr:hypothetical protein [Clostridia bacterium]